MHAKGVTEEWGASRVIMGGCRHSFPLVESGDV